MRWLVIFTLFWTFIGAYSDESFLPIDFILAVNMLIASVFTVNYFKSKWVSLTLVLSIPNFLNEIIPLLDITPHIHLLSTLTTVLILTAAYMPKNLTKWNL
jgi:hypothetical protein